MNQGHRITNTREQITASGARPGKQVMPGTVLLSFKLSIGKVARAGMPLYTNEAIAALPIKDTTQLDEGYLLRALQAMDLAGNANRAAMGATLNKAKLHAIPIPLPNLREQRRIAAILDHADALRAKRRQILAHLETLSQSIFTKMFESVVESRPFAETCMRVTVGVVVRPATFYVDSGVPALRTLNVKPGRIDLRDLVFFSEASNSGPLAKSRLRAGDLVIARTGKAGTTATVPPELDGANAIDLIVATPNPAIALAGYLEALLNSHLGRRIVSGESRGQVQQHFNVGSLKAASVPVPPLAQQHEFANRIATIKRQRAYTQSALDAEGELFASLQARAFRGEL
jgi:type I restriction enzyme, S subunit